MKYFTKTFLGLLCLMMQFGVAQAQVFFNESSSTTTNSIEGGATWENTGTDFIYNNNGTSSAQRALIYSTQAYQSEDGFRLTFYYNTGSIGNTGSHNFSIGLVSSDTNLGNYSGTNPFGSDDSVYSVGVNLTNHDGRRGMNFSNGNTVTSLDQSGTRAQFETGTSTKVFVEIGRGGSWSYYINDVFEEAGAVAENVDLSKNYHLVVYGQDDNGSEKTIESITLEKAPAPGERAASVIAGTWTAGTMDPSILADFKTIGHTTVGFNSGAVYSAQHFAPHKLLENLSGGDTDVVPLWGDLSQDEPQNDQTLAEILAIREAGVHVSAYTNSDTFTGSNADNLVEIAALWKNWCDTDPVAQAFIDSQPYHTGVWNGSEYVDASNEYPDRKYLFCYAEFILKDYSIRYGKYIDSWVFDSGSHITSHGDNNTSGVIEEQRIYQAWTNAVRAGNPDIATAYNNSRSTTRYYAYPYAPPVNFEDFAFAHAFGGNYNHAEKVNGNQYNLNYQHIERIIETNGHVFDGGGWDWASEIVGNFNSKVSTAAWNFGGAQAWEEADFLRWNLESLQNGGSMMWSGSVYRWDHTLMQDWSYDLYKALDDHLAKNLNPGAPNWARAYTYLPDAEVGETYSHDLVEDVDFWDPEGDDITNLIALNNPPSWLTINESSPGVWTLSGTPTNESYSKYEFRLRVSDASGNSNRWVTLNVSGETEETETTTTFTPDPSKTYYIDNPRFNRRLAATGESEDAYTTSTETTDNDVQWQFVAKGNGSWHIQRAAGGSKPRLRSDNSENTDMQETTSNGGFTYFNMESTGSGDTYFFTLPDGPSDYNRLQVDNSGQVNMVPSSSNGSWESFTITEAGFINSTNSSTLVHITKRNATGFAIDGDNGSADFQSIYLWEEDSNNVNQQWIEIDRGEGYYSYQKTGTHHCIDGGIGGVDGQDVYLYTCGENNQNQHWQKIDAGEGAFKLIKRSDSGYALDGGNGGINEQNVNLYRASSSSQNLHWFITPIGTSAKAIDVLETEEIIIYPNPTNSTATIQRAANSTIYVYDINGRELLTAEILTNIQELDLSSLSIGVYYVQVKGPQSISVVKIIKE